MGAADNRRDMHYGQFSFIIDTGELWPLATPSRPSQNGRSRDTHDINPTVAPRSKILGYYNKLIDAAACVDVIAIPANVNLGRCEPANINSLK